MNFKIMVDTSVWIEYFRGKLGHKEEMLERGLNQNLVFVTGPIVSELLQGVKSAKEYEMLGQCIDAIPYVNCEYGDWIKAGEMAFELRRKGITIPLSDIIIAAVAIRIGAKIYTRDQHFKKIADVKLYLD